MAELKPWYQTVTPRADLRENRPMDASEFAVHLDHIREGRETVAEDYLDPARFFERTYLTKSLLELAVQVVRRLSGIQVETSAVFNMATQFGGGKTHSLTTLYHLATNGDTAKAWKGVESILRKATVSTVPKANVAVFVGTEFDAVSGRSAKGEPTRKTAWGELAWQLRGREGFDLVAEHDRKGIAPAGDVIRKLIGDKPTLLLIDELMNYITRVRKLGLRDQFFAFLQSLCEETRAQKNVVLCASIPSSTDLEMSPEDVRDFQSLKKLLDRLGKAIMMSADTEMAEIIRRRLFEWDGLPKAGEKTVAHYSQWAVDHAPELSGIDSESAHELFRSSYPFHPSVLSVFERKWQSLPRFQRTRGVLRLLALWVAHAFQEEHRQAVREPLITLGSAPFENPLFRSAMFEQLGSNELEVPVTTDIAGKKEAHALRLDREARPEIQKARLHRKVASTIFFESNGGMSQSKAEAALPEIRTGVGDPETNLLDLDDALEGLVGSCYYLNWDNNRYRFGLTPNLNQILVSRRGAVQQKEIDERIAKVTQEILEAGSKALDRRYFPERSNDIPNRPVLTLVVLGMEQPAGDPSTNALMEKIVRECGNSGRTYKSALIFAVPNATEAIYDSARDVLAWEGIDSDTDTRTRLDETQERLLARNLNRARSDLREALYRSYRYLHLLGKDNKLRQIDLGQITSSSSDSLVDQYVGELTRTDELTAGVGSSKLIKYWPPALTEWSTKGVRDAFYSSPQLPRLLEPDALRRTLSDGVTRGDFGYATKDGEGKLRLQCFGESFSEMEVEFGDEDFILRAEDARKLLEPPRLDRLEIRPSSVVLQPGESAEFSCSGIDQYGQPFGIESPSWSSTVGDIDESGHFRSDEDGEPGAYSVKAEGGGREAIAEVRLIRPQTGNGDGGSGDGGDEDEGRIAWSGDVPPRKWMNFYTKVLSRFAGSEDLKITVRFEVTVDADHAAQQKEEVRSNLKALGLDEGSEPH